MFGLYEDVNDDKLPYILWNNKTQTLSGWFSLDMDKIKQWIGEEHTEFSFISEVEDNYSVIKINSFKTMEEVMEYLKYLIIVKELES